MLGIIVGVFVSNVLQPKANIVIPSPLEAVLRLSADEVAQLPYPPDALPGIRDIASPYGNLRAYEWGPEDGRKVLMVHGISTPCIALADIAHGLVESGCRVLLFDLPGRGYSSAPAPVLHPQSSAFFTAVILIALASSPIAWASPSSFSILGYSLGGGIAVNFVASFPNLVSSVILLAPSGLIRPHHFGWQSRLLYSDNFLPNWIIERLVIRKMRNAESTDPDNSGSAVEEKLPNAERNETSSCSKRRFNITKVVDWQMQNHSGAIKSIISSIRHAPISGQHAHWTNMFNALKKRDAGSREHSASSCHSIQIICGESDPIIVAEELKTDAVTVLGGPENLVFEIVDAGHDFPFTESNQVVDKILKCWNFPKRESSR